MAQHPTTLRIPSAPLAAGVPLPRVCPRHGRTAVATRRITFASRVPGWVYLLVLAGVLVMVLVASLITTRVKAPAVPVCERCLAERKERLTVMWAGLAAMPVAVAVVGSGALGDGAASAAALLLGVVAAPLVAAVAGVQGRWASLVRGVVEGEGAWVTIKEPAPAFAAAFAALAAPVVPQPWSGPPPPLG